jgi:hypothetical protein
MVIILVEELEQITNNCVEDYQVLLKFELDGI